MSNLKSKSSISNLKSHETLKNEFLLQTASSANRGNNCDRAT
jgi:hypothetical protein